MCNFKTNVDVKNETPVSKSVSPFWHGVDNDVKATPSPLTLPASTAQYNGEPAEIDLAIVEAKPVYVEPDMRGTVFTK